MAFTVIRMFQDRYRPSSKPTGRSGTLTTKVEFTGEYDPDAAIRLVADEFDDLTPIGGFPDFDTEVFASQMSSDLATNSNRTGTSALHGVAIVTTEFEPYRDQGWTLHPLDRDPEISGGGLPQKRASFFDATGRRVTNAAEDLFKDPLELFVRGGGHDITVNLEHNPSDMAFFFSRTMCNAPWYGVDKYKAMVEEIKFSRVVELFGGVRVPYWRATFPIRYHARGWLFEAINLGLKDINGKPAMLLGAFAQEPQTLDKNGYFVSVAPGTDPMVWPPADDVTSEPAGFKELTPEDWDDLPIPVNPFTWEGP